MIVIPQTRFCRNCLFQGLRDGKTYLKCILFCQFQVTLRESSIIHNILPVVPRPAAEDLAGKAHIIYNSKTKNIHILIIIQSSIGLFLSTETAAKHHHHNVISSCILCEMKFSNCYLEHMSHKKTVPTRQRKGSCSLRRKKTRTKNTITHHRPWNGKHRCSFTAKCMTNQI